MYSLLHILMAEVVGYPIGLLILVGADVLAIFTAPSVLLRRRGRPSSAIGWLLALFVVPYLGVLWWWLVGRESIDRRLRRRRQRTQEFCACLDDADKSAENAARRFDLEPVLPPGFFQRSHPLEVLGPSRPNDVDLLVDGEAAFRVMEEMIERAGEFVHVLFYIWEDDATGARLRDLLVDKARAGVEVRVLVDPVGSPEFVRRLAPPLREAGAKVGLFLVPRWLTSRPTLNFRNHRKLIVIDGREALTGGMNVGVEYEHEWHDLMVHLRGPVVGDLHTVFLDDWFFATGENLVTPTYLKPHAEQIELVAPGDLASCAVLASGPDRESSALQDAVLHAISTARQRIWVTTPYLVPGPEMLAGFRLAAQRGVDVRVLLPEESDVALVRRASRAYYGTLISSGVRIFEYQPRVLHAKSLVIDDQWALVGSANTDVRSFMLNFELSVFVASRSLNAALARVFEADMGESAEIGGDEMRAQSPFDALVDAIAHLASPLL